MRKWLIFLITVLSVSFLSTNALYAREKHSGARTIVPADSVISDQEARLALARILSYDDANLKDSLAEYRILLAQNPSDTGLQVETAQVLSRLKLFDEAGAILREVLRSEPGNAAAIVTLADIECGKGHARSCRDLYLKALGLPGEKTSLKLRFADRMNTWGDFYGAESYYRLYLTGNPGDFDVTLKLASSLASSQRYEESESIYLKLISEGKRDARVLAVLAWTKLLEKDFAASLKYAKEALAVDPGNSDAANILAESLAFRGNFKEARDVYENMMSGKHDRSYALVNIGKTFLKEGKTENAREYFSRAYRAGPKNIAAAFYYNWPRNVRTKAFLSSISRPDDVSAGELDEWAKLYMSQGYFDEAIILYGSALKQDPEYFPASIGLAEALGINRRYDESIALYRKLAEEFPGNSKILIGLARVLGWSRRYDESIALYRKIIRLNPADPVPRREMARTAMWGKMPGLSMAAYDAAMADLGPDRRIQRSFRLEKEAKMLAHERRFTRSLNVYETLIDEYPGNEEALFDQAQVQCAMGMCDHEKKTYEKLLNIDPLHGLAGDALERLKERGNPSLRFDYSYWNEEGRGDLARITRNRFDLAFDLPITCRYHITLKGHRWLENPDYTGTTYVANGFSLGFSGVLSPFVKGDAAWTHKIYDSSDLGTKDTGHGTLWFNIHDRFSVAAGYARTDELYNFFGIEQGIQADRLWTSFHSDITRKFEIDAKAEYINYTDSNSGSFFGLSAGYAFTDHPRVLKITLSGELRNTRHDNEYIYRNGFLTNIIHPYWAPRDYSAGSIIFEWRHDLSKLFICGAEQHYYDIKASFGTDSEDNPYARLEGEWSYEFKKHWMAGVKGMVHSSPEWNAGGAWAHLRYRF